MILVMPRPGDHLVILKPITTPQKNNQYIGFHGRDTSSMTTRYIHETVVWPLEVGEWYKVVKIISGPTYEKQYPTLSLSIHRSNRKRKWIKAKLSQLIVETVGLEDSKYAKSTDRNLYCNSEDLNGKVMIVSSEAEAILEREKLLSLPKEALPSRWALIQKG